MDKDLDYYRKALPVGSIGIIGSSKYLVIRKYDWMGAVVTELVGNGSNHVVTVDNADNGTFVNVKKPSKESLEWVEEVISERFPNPARPISGVIVG